MRKMKKYIDVDKLIEFANNHIAGIDANDIARFPRADAQEVKYGKWETFDCDKNSYKCSACGDVQYLVEGTPKDNNYNYCPTCGAKMGIEIERAEK